MGGRRRTPGALATTGRAHSSRCPHVSNDNRGLLRAWADFILRVRRSRRAGGFPGTAAISAGKGTAATEVSSSSATATGITGDGGWTGENTGSWTRTRACSDGDVSLPLNSGRTQTCKYRNTFPQTQSCSGPIRSFPGHRPGPATGGGTMGILRSGEGSDRRLEGAPVLRSRRRDASGSTARAPPPHGVAPFAGLWTGSGLRGSLVSKGGIMPGTAWCPGGGRC